jgi:hypothetical protein
MKRAAILLVLMCSSMAQAQAIKCIGVGWLQLTNKQSNTVYCRTHGNTGKILWGVTYGAKKNEFILYSVEMNSFFYVPAQPNQRYIGSAVRGTSDAWYSMTSSPYEDEHRTFVSIVGH